MTARLIEPRLGHTIQALCDDDGWRGGVYDYESNQAHYEANQHNADVHGVGPLARTSAASGVQGDAKLPQNPGGRKPSVVRTEEEP